MDETHGVLGAARPGERWVVRHRLADGSATDAVGWIEEVTDAAVRLRDAEGSALTIERAAVVLARRAPTAAGGPDPRRTAPEALERIAASGWSGESEPLGEWILRTGEATSADPPIACLAVGDPGLPIARAADVVLEWSQRHAIPPRAQVVVGSDVEAGLAALDWAPTNPGSDVLVVRLGGLLGNDLPDPRVSIDDRPSEAWLEAYLKRQPEAAELEATRRRVAVGPAYAFATAYAPDGTVLVIVRGHLSRIWLGLTPVWAGSAAEASPHTVAALRALGHWAARRGARYAYLEAAHSEPASTAAYLSLGFVPHHRNRVLAAPAPTGHLRPV